MRLIVVAILLAAPVLAQPEMFAKGGERAQHMELLRMWRLVDALEIDEEQAMRVFPAFREHRATVDSLQKTSRSLQAALKKQLEGDVEDDELEAAMQSLRKVRAQIDAEKESFETRLSGLLTTRQQAQLLLFDTDFRNDLVNIVRRIRGGGAMEGSSRGRGRGPFGE